MPEKQKSFFVLDYGCSDRKLDANTLGSHLIKNNFSRTYNIKEADTIIATTCAHVLYSERKSMRDIARIKKIMKKDAKLIVSGCLPLMNPAKLREVFTGPTVPPLELGKINSILDLKNTEIEIDSSVNTSPLSLNKIKTFVDMYSLSGILELGPLVPELIKDYLLPSIRKKVIKKGYKRSNYYIPIGKGCLGECSFCVVKRVYGTLVSRKVEEIHNDFKEGLAKGYNTFYLLNKDIAAYGVDNGENLASLLEVLFSEKGEYNIFFTSSFYPKWVIDIQDEFIGVMKRNQHRVKEINISINSGSDDILEGMKRKNYSIPKLKKFINEFKEQVPEVELTGTIMVGFPGEGEKEFRQTIDFLKQSPVDELYVWRYDEKPGTVSALIKDKVPEDVIDSRILAVKKEMKRLKVKIIVPNQHNRPF